MNELLESYHDLYDQVARQMATGEIKEAMRVSLRRGLVVAAALEVKSRDDGRTTDVYSSSGTVYPISCPRWACPCEYHQFAPRFDFGPLGKGRLCKHVAAALLRRMAPSGQGRPANVLEAFERVCRAQVPTLMSANVKKLKEWSLYKRTRFNIDRLGFMRLRVVRGRSSPPLARVWPVEAWVGSGPAPYECNLLPEYRERYDRWLAGQREKELVA